MYMCIAPHARRHMLDPTFDLIDRTTCNRVGRVLERESTQRMQLYPLGNVVFYTQIPYIKGHVMSRLFQYMVADLGFQFTSSEYPERLMRKYTQVSFPDTQHVIWVLKKGTISIRRACGSLVTLEVQFYLGFLFVGRVWADRHQL